MKDFKSYTQGDDGNNGAQNGANCGGQNGANCGGAGNSTQGDGTAEIIKILSQAVRGKSEGQILRQIIAEAERGKRAGTLTNDDLDNFYSTVAPLLDGFKRQKLKQVITRLKSI